MSLAVKSALEIIIYLYKYKCMAANELNDVKPGNDYTPASPPPMSVYDTPSTSDGKSDSGDIEKDFITFKNKRKFPLASILFVAVALIFTVGMFYAGLNMILNQKENSSQNTEGEVSETATNLFSIRDGNIISNSGTGDIIINKDDYPDTGIGGFSFVNASPDGTKICFGSLSPAPSPSLYWASSDGSNTTKIGESYINCMWHTDNTRILFTDNPVIGERADIWLYDTSNEEFKNLTENLEIEGLTRIYTLTGISSNGKKAECSLSDYNSEENKTVDAGCEIDIP